VSVRIAYFLEIVAVGLRLVFGPRSLRLKTTTTLAPFVLLHCDERTKEREFDNKQSNKQIYTRESAGHNFVPP